MSSDLRQYYLQQMGIETWVLRGSPVSQNALKKLETAVSSCTRCPLHLTRTQTVFARGNPHAELMIVGEVPGFDEDIQGSPFVGKAGTLLHQMLSSIGLSENDVYMTNALKCRPPSSSDPLLEEMTQCTSFLTQQLALVEPKLILAVGQFPGQFLLNSTDFLANIRSKVHYYAGIPVVITFHPDHLLGNPQDKKKAYEDLILVKQLLAGSR